MSRISQQKESETEMSLQMAPMINVMLVTLAAFVATAGIVQTQEGLTVTAPQAGSAGIFDPPVEIGITPTGEIYFNHSKITEDSEKSANLLALEQRLKRVLGLLPNPRVIIRPHADTKHEQVVQVVDVCKALGVKKLSFGEKS